MVIDPVCGMKVDERSTRFKNDYQGKTYYFCSAGCLRAFEHNPGKYAKTGQADFPDAHG